MRFRLVSSLATVVFVFGLTATSASAQATASVCKDGTTSAASGKGACSSHGGVDAKATEAAKKAAATVTCSDGATSKAGRGACSRHGGVKSATTSASTPTPVPAATAVATKTPARTMEPRATKTATKVGGNDDPTDATAQCKDGTYSHAKTHQGACSKHRGVAKFLK